MTIKSIKDARYQAAINALREKRMAMAMTQRELATALGRSQQFVSKFESLERRLDMIEFIDVAETLSLDWIELLRSRRGGR